MNHKEIRIRNETLENNRVQDITSIFSYFITKGFNVNKCVITKRKIKHLLN